MLRPLITLRKYGIGAAIPVISILAAHWLRYHRLDFSDFLTSFAVFICYLGLASWLGSRRVEEA